MTAQPSIALTIATNLPAILVAATPIVTALIALVVTLINRKQIAVTKAATNQVIKVTQALRETTLLKQASEQKNLFAMTGNHGISIVTIPIPELPELLK